MDRQQSFQELNQMDVPGLEKALRSSQAFVHTLMDSIHIGICHVNTQGQILSLNLEGARILHRTETSCLGQSFHAHAECLHVDLLTQEEHCPITRAITTGQSIWTPQLLIRRPSGETRWVEFQCTQLTDPRHSGALVIFRDLSQQLQQHEAHQHLASMPEESPNPIVEVDAQGHLAYANPAMIRLLDTYGFREDGVPMVLPATLTQLAMGCLKTIAPIRGLTVVVEHRHFDWTFSPIQEKGLVRGYGLDITHHVRVRQTLTELQSQYFSLVDSAHEGIISADLHGTIVSWNPAAEAIFGYQPDEVLGHSIVTLLEEGYRDMYRKGLEDISYGRSSTFPIQQPLELTGLRKSGELFSLEISSTSWKIGLDTHYGFILRDISDRKRLEHALIAEKDYLVTTLQSVAEGIVTTDQEGHISFLNPLAEQITEWTTHEALHRPFQEIFRLTSDRPKNENEPSLQFSSRAFVLSELDTPHQLLTKHGLQRTITLREGPIRDHSGHLVGTVIVFRDITDQTRHQEEQQRISKLNSLGVLAGGLAHDFNNILTTILGNVFVAKLRMVSNDPLTQNLEQAEQACLRAKELTQQLLTFAKGGAPIKTSIALGDLLRKSTIFALSGSSISCHFDIPDDLWPLDADPGQLRQVIQNITINARQAMPHGGHLSVKVENVGLKNPSALPSPSLIPGNYIKFSFEDQGTGIEDRQLSNIFDPYYTTKPGASGLGLATAHSIIQQHHGHISVTSKVGIGTTFTVYIPSSHVTPEDGAPSIPAIPRKDRGRVLVMDDEDSIRRMVEDALTQFGYDVVGVPDGQAAIDLVSQSLADGKKFEVVILDLTIPGAMGGKKAIQHLRDLDPHIKAIVTSGYSDDPIMCDFQQHGFQGILVKPYKIFDLAKILESMFSPTKHETTH
ncbi:MAG: PAS domain S-box protein [Nitrospirota bacterium]|nr:PAS domain S-box protein [Nitrospirota bacterium]